MCAARYGIQKLFYNFNLNLTLFYNLNLNLTLNNVYKVHHFLKEKRIKINIIFNLKYSQLSLI